MSFSVTHRTPEIGRQIACGAKTSKVLKLVLWHGMKLALLGAVQGLAVAFLLAGWIKALLLGVSATDPLTFLVVTLLLGVVAFAVYYLLTRRAAKEEPIALRYE
jgi:ABC-type lipoprotein release transport system permease subunit